MAATSREENHANRETYLLREADELRVQVPHKPLARLQGLTSISLILIIVSDRLKPRRHCR
jgi:hypothetical protein